MYLFLGGVKVILDVEFDLYLELCGFWGLLCEDIELVLEDSLIMVYIWFVFDVGMVGDFLDLQVVFVFCIIGYVEIGVVLKWDVIDLVQNLYRCWIEEYSGDVYQEIVWDFVSWMD